MRRVPCHCLLLSMTSVVFLMVQQHYTQPMYGPIGGDQASRFLKFRMDRASCHDMSVPWTLSSLGGSLWSLAYIDQKLSGVPNRKCSWSIHYLPLHLWLASRCHSRLDSWMGVGRVHCRWLLRMGLQPTLLVRVRCCSDTGWPQCIYQGIRWTGGHGLTMLRSQRCDQLPLSMGWGKVR
jgi:hypothetical protein